MKETVLQLIQLMEAEKREKKIIPDHITGPEISQAIKTSLRQLVDEGSIHAGNTMNDYYVRSISEQPVGQVVGGDPNTESGTNR